jgi:hypothetical protein
MLGKQQEVSFVCTAMWFTAVTYLIGEGEKYTMENRENIYSSFKKLNFISNIF